MVTMLSAACVHYSQVPVLYGKLWHDSVHLILYSVPEISALFKYKTCLYSFHISPGQMNVHECN